MNELRKRSMITRYRIQRLWTPVLLLMLLILVTAIAGGTQAQETWRIAVKLDEAFSISNSDGNGWDNPDEMYWKVQITPTVGDGETRICTTREVVVARRRIQPGWICDAEVSGPSDTVVQINVELWDYDDLLQFDDDRFDIHPDPDISVITMAYRPASNLLSIEDFAGWEAPGRCPVGRLSMRGFHGPEFARVWFSVSSSIADSSSGDSDNDGLFDSWEQCGVNMDDDTAVDVDLPAMGADPMKKDLFVEVDWMVDDDGIGNDHSHEPWLPAMITAVEELAAAPVNNPDGSSGISLHVDTGELYEGHSIDYNNDGTAEISLAANGLDLDGDRVNESFLLPGSSIPSIGLLGAMGVGTPGGGNRVAHQIVLGFAPGSSSPFAAGSTFDDIKLANFDPARSGIFRYALFAHSKRNLDGSLWRGGEAECVGICDSFELHLARASGSGAPPRETFDLDGDGLPDLGSSFLPGPSGLPVDGTVAEHQGVFLHEFGHTMTLGHGGGDDVNFKPNYISIMNNYFAVSGLIADFNGDGIADSWLGTDRDRDGFPDPSRYMYSRQNLSPLNEAGGLVEPAGISDGPFLTWYGPVVSSVPGGPCDISCLLSAWGYQAIDWNRNGIIDTSQVTADINGDGNLSVLYGFRDFNAIQVKTLTAPEAIDLDEIERMRRNQRPLKTMTSEDELLEICTDDGLRLIDFDDQSPGTAITDEYMPPAVFSSIDGPPLITSGSEFRATMSPPNALVNWPPPDANNAQPLEIKLDPPQRLVGLYVGRNDRGGTSDKAVLKAYDRDGYLIGTVEKTLPRLEEGISSFIGAGAILADRTIARMTIHYESVNALEPVAIDNLVLCETKREVDEPVLEPGPTFGDLPVSVEVRAEVAHPGSELNSEPLPIHTPLAGVPIMAGGTEDITHFSLEKHEGERISLSAPSSHELSGANLEFVHWKMNGHVFFPESIATINPRLLADATFTAVYIPQEKSCRLAVSAEYDSNDVAHGDGVCADGQGQCTLRAAVEEANAFPGACLITVPEGVYRLTIPGTGEDAAATGDLDLADDVSILGAGDSQTVVDGNKIDTVFDVLAGVQADIVGMTIRNGYGLGYPGGIDNEGQLFMGDVTVRENASSGNAGGIWNNGSLDFINSQLIKNRAAFNGGGLYNRSGEADLSRSTVAGNSTDKFDGGGIGNNLGTINLNAVTVSGNSARHGGGVSNDARLSMVNSTISGNSADGAGGGIYNRGNATSNNSTITANSSTVGTGGGVWNDAAFSLSNSIIAGNKTGSGARADCQGIVTSAGHNLIQERSGCTVTGNPQGNLSGSDPLLGPLTDNGGPTETHALMASSPARDSGNSTTGGEMLRTCERVDQRNVLRPRGFSCDIGAVEMKDESPRSPVFYGLLPIVLR